MGGIPWRACVESGIVPGKQVARKTQPSRSYGSHNVLRVVNLPVCIGGTIMMTASITDEWKEKHMQSSSMRHTSPTYLLNFNHSISHFTG